MAIWSNLVGASTKRAFTSSALIRNTRQSVQHAKAFAPVKKTTPTPKTWLNRYVTPPNRPMTAGEYAFIEGTKRAALGIGAAAYVSGAVYVLFFPRYPPRMLKLMAELPPEQAERLWEMETNLHLPHKLY